MSWDVLASEPRGRKRTYIYNLETGCIYMSLGLRVVVSIVGCYINQDVRRYVLGLRGYNLSSEPKDIRTFGAKTWAVAATLAGKALVAKRKG